MSDSSGKTLLALMAGAAVGAGIGILFAPDKGSVTRAKIREGVDDATHTVGDKVSTAANQLKAKGKQLKTDLQSQYEVMVSNASYKTEDIITFLEKKLADLKTENAKLHK